MASVRPQERPCFEVCRSCFRCDAKGSRDCPHPYSCSGHIETPKGHKWSDDDIDDQCRCKEGVIQVRLKDGRLVRRRYLSSPFETKVMTDAETQDDRDWNAYVDEQRELRDDPFFDPLTFDGHGSVTDWMRNARTGRR